MDWLHGRQDTGFDLMLFHLLRDAWTKACNKGRPGFSGFMACVIVSNNTLERSAGVGVANSSMTNSLPLSGSVSTKRQVWSIPSSFTPRAKHEPDTFEKIIAREIPAEILYEDDRVLAFRDISAPGSGTCLDHSQKPIPRVGDASREDQALLGHLLLTAGEVARELGLQDGFRLVMNHGKNGGETVPHLHCHLPRGRPLKWPPG